MGVIFSSGGYDVVILDGVEIQALLPIAYIATVQQNSVLSFTVADLTQTLKEAKFIFSWDDAKYETNFPFPDGDNKGKSVNFSIAPLKLKGSIFQVG